MIVKIVSEKKNIKKTLAMHQLKSYVVLLLLVSTFPVVMPHIRNLSPLRGIVNTDLPDALRTTTVAAFAFSEASTEVEFDFDGGFASQSLGTVAGFGSFGGEQAFRFRGDSVAASSSTISDDDVEDALEFAFKQIASGNRFRPQGQTPPRPTFSSPSGGAASAASSSLSGGPDIDYDYYYEYDEASAADDYSSSVQGLPDDSFQESFSFEEAPFPDLDGISLALFEFRLTQPASEQDSNCIGRPLELASRRLKQRNDMTPARLFDFLTNYELKEDSCLKQQRRQNCPSLITPYSGMLCNPNAQYRTLNGSCNNLGNPEWGTSKRRFNRYLTPAYEDGISKMRGDEPGISLPSARTVSAGLQGIPGKPPREDLTLMVMQWGQFLDHDLTHTPEATRDDEDNTPSPIICCDNGVPGSTNDDNCRPIDVSNDQLFRAANRRCMHFVRSLVASKGCSTGSLGPREQQNQLTSYLDASQVYGSDDVEAEGLRSESGGLLKDSQRPSVGHGTFLPRTNCRNSPNNDKICFEAGDVRVNELPALTSMHTLWLRVHNNIAKDLAYLNPRWDDEILYQETRRIVAALHQQITYREFLPIVHGPDSLREFQLNLQDQGYDNSYDSSVDATIVNVFATAAFRYGHTLIAESFKGMGRNLSLRGNFFDPSVLNEPSTSPTALLHGLTACPTQGSDAFLTPTLVNHLFSKSDAIGLDLMALNIQRGRDHGLPPYHEWRRSCGLSAITSFEDLSSIMDPDAAMVLQQTYQSVQDIDLFPAGLAENTMPGGLLGPTFTCLLAQQFQALKKGDRFWYENQNQPNNFTLGQLSALREQSLASIMCQHLELDSLQSNVFRSERQPGNQLKDCSAFPRLNLQFWSQGSDQPNRCVGVGVWQQVPGMDQWCTDNCHHSVTQYCPTSHCSCT